MKGAVAAGHPLTAQAGARVLEEGGNAVDACVAAAFAAGSCESFLTSPGAGRLHARPPRARRARRGSPTSSSPRPGSGCDAPRRARWRRRRRLRRRRRDDPAVPDRPCVVAVPGAVAGLEASTARTGGCPGRSCSQPATELARGGVELTRPQAHLHALLDPILRHSDEGRRIYSRADGARLVAGDTLRLPDLADTFEAIAAAARRRSTAASGRGRSSRRCATAAAS